MRFIFGPDGLIQLPDLGPFGVWAAILVFWFVFSLVGALVFGAIASRSSQAYQEELDWIKQQRERGEE